MIQDAWITTFLTHFGDEVIVVRVPHGTLRSRWHGQRVLNALRANLSLQQLTQDAVAIEDASAEATVLVGSSPAAEIFIRSILPQIETVRQWKPTKLNL